MGTGLGLARITIERLDRSERGRVLHRRLRIAAVVLFGDVIDDYMPRDGLDLMDGTEPFVASVQRTGERASRWLIVVRDPQRCGEEVARGLEVEDVTEPVTVAATFSYERGTRRWRITGEEVYAFDANFARALALRAASESGLPTDGAFAGCELDEDGIWVDLTVPVTPHDARWAHSAVQLLLDDLPVSVVLDLSGSLPDKPAERHEA